MVKIPHEALHHIFREDPGMFTRTMRRIMDEAYPEILKVAELNCDLTEIKAIDREADTVLVTDTVDGRQILLIEPQTDVDVYKARRWAWYIAFLENKYSLPVTLLVITAETKTAEWSRGPLVLGPPGRPSMRVFPRVLGPDNMDFITDPDRAAEDVGYAVFAALVNRRDCDIERALRPLAFALDTLDRDTGRYWAEYVEGGLEGCTRQLWKDIMMSMTGYVSEFRREGIEQGREQGLEQSLLIVLESRGLRLDGVQRERVASCADEDVLRTWMARAATATTVSEVFAD